MAALCRQRGYLGSGRCRKTGEAGFEPLLNTLGIGGGKSVLLAKLAVRPERRSVSCANVA